MALSMRSGGVRPSRRELYFCSTFADFIQVCEARTWSSPRYVVTSHTDGTRTHANHKSVGSAAVGRAVRPDRAP
eukprot:2244574-Prymnesium_polylepis.1